MKRGATYMNSFLFNVALLLLTSLPVVQFSVEAFSSYAAETDVANIFNVQVRYLKGIGTLFEEKVFIYMFLILSGLSGMYLLARPKDTPASAVKMKQMLNRNRNASRI